MSEQQVVVTYELDGEVALVGLNRPEKRNAFNHAQHEQLLEAVTRAGKEAKCGVLFGHGESFCAGLDLAQTAATWGDGVSHRLPFRRTLAFELIARGPIPFVAALHGATVGGGLEVAACAHIRVADETAYFANPEGQRGIFVGGGGSVRIARLMGVARMADLMLTSRVIKADEAKLYNLAQYVVPKGEALAKAKEIARTICKNAPLANFAITNSLPRLQDMSYDDGLYVERLIYEYTRSPESAERLRAFVDKKAPKLQVPE